MLDQLQSPVSSLKEKLKLATYQTLFNNVRARLCSYEETLDFDFFSSFHPNAENYALMYGLQPTMYHCKGNIGFQGMFGAGNSYLVVARFGKVVLFLEPEAAVARNLPFIAVLEGNFFRPYLGCAVTYWQSYLEPLNGLQDVNVFQSNALSPIGLTRFDSTTSF